MLNHHPRELERVGDERSLPQSLSPKSQRRAEIAIKQLQNGVVGRARSTITTLADIWKSKIDTKPNRIDPPATNRRNLDVMNVWSRQRRSASASRTVHNSIESRADSRIKSDDMSFADPNCSDQFVRGKKNVHKQEIGSIIPKEGADHLSTSQRLRMKYLGRFSRNKSFEVNDMIAERKSLPQSRRRLSDGKLNNYDELKKKNARNANKRAHIIQNDANYIELVRPKCREIGNAINFLPTGNARTDVKAKLKLEKVESNDDIILNKSVEMIKPRLLLRKNTVTPLIKVSSVDDGDVVAKPQTIFKKSRESSPNPKPTKKLSFREPIVCDANGKVEPKMRRRQCAAPNVENCVVDELNQIELEVNKHGTEFLVHTHFS